ncbi:NAD(P)-dependent glycerol-3-phosphate dehydrogenase [Altericroceibacterium spongiae]|uniref:Glycerol-3-phosphate dehydrogenase [NAD(P)+] n=1 Tax=Altericroceibacterium spongiae TaxID=2320269 RepID=A0A420EC16_9SPHN|nr:NAD(P)H-dependent glycerol-3-phosphate dehydrogenase [Altericroceibacterium spongiae]RKF18216.1 NAD(P)-dependent glycerol-3-phosphate dehydrogenase [Altericroceibacterium spongiae]
MSDKRAQIGVIGAGAWGTALAQMLSSDGRDVLIWARDNAVVTEINETHSNTAYLPEARLADTIQATSSIALLADCTIVLVVTPAQKMGEVLAAMPHFPRDIVLCSKGIEAGSFRLMNQVARSLAPDSDIAVLSGPTFAHEVVAGMPTAVTLACGGGTTQWDRLSEAIARPAFRPYYSDDLTGAEIGGAVKNVLAIACGVVEGLQLGQNARAALIARGYAEMMRFGESLGADRDTLSGLCGLGDLVLTCSSTSSRNFSLGKALGEGRTPADLMKDRRTVAEGAFTAPVLRDLAGQHNVAMPITEAVCRLLEGGAARDLAGDLLARPLKSEGPSA